MHDLLSFDLIINLESEEVSGCSQLELGDAVPLVLLDSDLFGFWQVLLFMSHDLYEFLQVFNFLWLYTVKIFRSLPLSLFPLIYNKYKCYFNKTYIILFINN